jgi:hypothetical protein
VHLPAEDVPPAAAAVLPTVEVVVEEERERAPDAAKRLTLKNAAHKGGVFHFG